ncbi:hypothetical protein [Helicobacter fennelliae]|uniref:hypothetical protein n=1 Tax=Helicobacter fennelliae TaxID=215 RepID=UPI000DD37976|nr:hypothetical protein [Helicobacter fennelliae]
MQKSIKKLKNAKMLHSTFHHKSSQTLQNKSHAKYHRSTLRLMYGFRFYELRFCKLKIYKFRLCD